MKILQVIPNLDTGGAERTTIEIAEALTRDGHTAFVASEGGAMEGELEAAGGELIRLPLSSKSPLTIWKNANRLAVIIRERGVDIVHAKMMQVRSVPDGITNSQQNQNQASR